MRSYTINSFPFYVFGVRYKNEIRFYAFYKQIRSLSAMLCRFQSRIATRMEHQRQHRTPTTQWGRIVCAFWGSCILGTPTVTLITSSVGHVFQDIGAIFTKPATAPAQTDVINYYDTGLWLNKSPLEHSSGLLGFLTINTAVAIVPSHD